MSRSTATRLAPDLDRRAIAGARRGDWDAVHFLYVRHADAVRGVVDSLLESPSEADEITQSIFAAMPGSIEGFDADGEAFSTWLLGVARQAAARHQASGPATGPLWPGGAARSVARSAT